MNLFGIIEEIEKVDPEFNERISPRRAAIKNITSFGSKVAVAALPFAVSEIFKKAYSAASTTDIVGVLNFALTLEYLESSFYNQGLATSGLITDTAYITPIARDENNHVTFLTSTITSLGGTPVAKSSLTFDFTAGNGHGNGPFANVFSSYQTFLAVAETFEDTGVRAYKGQAGVLIGNQTVLTAALGIHAVEARHAAALRYLRTMKGFATVKPWIVSPTASSTDVSGANSNDTGIAGVNGNYGGATAENNTSQGGVDITKLPSIESSSSTSVGVASAAFDEPLTMAEVLALLQGTFIVH
jgi:hypothetical protein